MVEVIPKEKLLIIPYNKREKFLVLKRTKKKILLSGLKNYLKNKKKKLY